MFMKNAISRFAADESGATAIEYALLASLVAVAVIGAMTTLGTNIGKTFNNVSSNLK